MPRVRSSRRRASATPPAVSSNAAIIATAIAAAATVLNAPVLSPRLNRLCATLAWMGSSDQQARLEEAFERIEETILPCIAMMLDTLLDASASLADTDPRALAAELQTLAAQLEELTRAVERSSPRQLDPGEYKTAAA
jgi:hypothetical protein